MRIYPQDLGTKWHVGVLHLRQRHPVPANHGVPPTKMGPMGQSWARGLGLEPAQAAAALRAARGTLRWNMFCSGLIGGLLTMVPISYGAAGLMETSAAAAFAAALAAGSGWLTVLIPGVEFRRLHRQPVQPAELSELLELAYHAMDQEFLLLVRAAIRQEASPGTEASVRTAIRALGEAVYRVPSVRAVPRSMPDTTAMRSEAEQLHAQAQAEPDHVTADSLERRARAVLHRAEAGERSALLVKRAEALRAEIDAQIAALRESLAAFDAQAPDTAGLAFLAEAARQVAIEVESVAAAREELDAYVAHGALPAAAKAPMRFRTG